MPVPVPTRTPAHSVNKLLPVAADAPPPALIKQSALKHLLNSLPEPPSGPPPAFTDRETWIKSLPPSRRYKVRQDVTTPRSGTSPVTLGKAEQRQDATHASKTRTSSMCSAHSPNALVVPRNPTMIASVAVSAAVSKVAHAPLSNGKPWPPSPPKAIKQAIKADERRKAVLGDATLACDSGRDADDELSEEWTEDEAFFAGPTVHRQTSVKKTSNMDENKENVEAIVERMDPSVAFVPLVEFDSDVDVPLAPFDGTLAASAGIYPGNDTKDSAFQPALDPVPAYAPVQNQQAPNEQRDAAARKALSPIPTTITPADMLVYNRKIAEPMSEWVAEYIWKVVTHGMSLPPEFVADETGYGNTVRSYATQPPAYLADSIRTLLCSTLLQPSAIFLALWYIARLPIFFGVFAYDAKKQAKEYKFRLELLGEGSQEPGAERTRQLLEAHAPFRLFLLGVMLSNKWLDDNTFSNKTWHQVSGVPMRALNRLESLGLDLLSHDLSMLPRAWEQWLDHVQSYHRSLAPYPEPIGPPKDTPHVVIRRTIDDLIAAGSPPLTTGVLPEPVFLGLEDRKKERERERLAKEEFDLLDLDLDEDGPLREEYLPKRRREIVGTEKDRRAKEELERVLPPPAEWSPAADPPIHRARPLYQAVQRPPPAPVPAHAHAHVPEAALYVPQANGYFNRSDAIFQDNRSHGHVHVQGHGHHRSRSHGWPAPEEYRYSGQPDRFAYAQPAPPSYAPVYNAQYPVAVAAVHQPSGPWVAPPSFAAQQPSAGGYQPVGAFDAPPPSDLFRPTWLRT